MIDIFSVKSWGESSNKETEAKSLQTTSHRAYRPSVNQKKVFTPIKEILSYFDKDKIYTKDEALRLIGLVSNYSTRQVYDVYERLAFEGAIKIQKNINSKN